MDENTLEIGKTDEAKVEGTVIRPEVPVEEVVTEPKPEVVIPIHEDAEGNLIPTPTAEDELVQG